MSGLALGTLGIAVIDSKAMLCCLRMRYLRRSRRVGAGSPPSTQWKFGSGTTWVSIIAARIGERVLSSNVVEVRRGVYNDVWS